LSCSAIGRCLVALALLSQIGATQAPLERLEQVPNKSNPTQAKQTQEGGYTSLSATDTINNYWPPFRADENSEEAATEATKRDKEDIIAQKVMAAAADRMIYIAWLQYFVGVGSLIGLAFTVYYTQKTAKAGVEAAKASIDMAGIAREANQLTRDAMVADKRAWLKLDEISLQPQTSIQESGALIIVKATIKNIGHTPALNVWFDTEIHFLREGVSFGEAETAFKARQLAFNAPVGHTMFPTDPVIERRTVRYGPETFAKSIRVRNDTGERIVQAIMMMAVTYRVFGDERPHITYTSLDLISLEIGLSVPENGFVPLRPVPFTRGEVT
tara:strand:+ start:983 stop:1966 length:984 start_codon:yes stop_codon:yes gene_type:complete